jgi:hypothetical protein
LEQLLLASVNGEETLSNEMADTILDMFRDLNKGKDGNKGERFVLL